MTSAFSNIAFSNNSENSTHIESLIQIEDNYDIFLIDMVGVIYDEVNALPGAIEAIKRLKCKSKRLVLLTNNPRPNKVAAKKLMDLGFPNNLEIVTSGDATRHYITTNYSGARVFHLGQQKNKDILEGLNIKLVNTVAEADFVLLTLFLEETEDPTHYDLLLKEISLSKKEIICANPDKTAPCGLTIRKTAGYFGEVLENMGANITYIGKPHGIMYGFLWNLLNLDESYKKRTLMIGDTIDTDIIGAIKFGIDSLLVLTGNTQLTLQKTNLPTKIYLDGLVRGKAPSFYTQAFS